MKVDEHLRIVREALWNVRAKWYDLGVELGVNVETLEVSAESSCGVSMSGHDKYVQDTKTFSKCNIGRNGK